MTPKLILLQVAHETTPTLVAIERAVALLARRDDAATGEHERDTCAREFARVCEEWRLGGAWLRAFAPEGSKPGPDDCLVQPNGVPWWRGHLVIATVSYCGFMGHRPWHAGQHDHAVRIFGTLAAVNEARLLYAASSIACASALRLAPPVGRDEFALGVALGMLQEMREEGGARAAAETQRNRTKMIVRPPEVATPAAEVERSAQDPNSPLRQGMAAARGRGRRALGKRPPPVQSVTFGGWTITSGSTSTI